MPRVPRIAIVGAGFSGLTTAIHLLHDAPAPIALLLIEQHAEYGGPAYRSQPACNLLNVPANRMSCLPDDPEHFLRYLHGIGSSCGPHDYIPRAHYGTYLRQQFTLAVSSKKAHASIQTKKATVAAVSTAPKGRGMLELRTSDGTRYEADYCILAMGNLPPVAPWHMETTVAHSPCYLNNPWNYEALAGLSPDISVLLGGSGLTMLDTALCLISQGHRGQITAISPHATIPLSHRSLAAALTVPDSLLKSGKLRDLVRWVRRQNNTNDLLRAVDGIRPYAQDFWRRFSHRDRARFLAFFQSHWDKLRHRVPPTTMLLIENLLSSGRLVLKRGRITHLKLCGNEHGNYVEASIRDDFLQRFAAHKFGACVNCTGPSIHPASSLLAKGLIEQGAGYGGFHGMGLATSATGELLNESGLVCRNLFTIGPWRRGDLWESTAVPELRVQAQALSQEILRRIRERGYDHTP